MYLSMYSLNTPHWGYSRDTQGFCIHLINKSSPYKGDLIIAFFDCAFQEYRVLCMCDQIILRTCGILCVYGCWL